MTLLPPHPGAQKTPRPPEQPGRAEETPNCRVTRQSGWVTIGEPPLSSARTLAEGKGFGALPPATVDAENRIAGVPWASYLNAPDPRWPTDKAGFEMMRADSGPILVHNPGSESMVTATV